MNICENCNRNEATIRIDTIINGHKEQRYFCMECAEKLRSEYRKYGAPTQKFDAWTNNEQDPLHGAAEQANQNNRSNRRNNNKFSKTPTIDQFGRDLTAEARDGKLDPAFGRDREIRRMLIILSRRQKNNPVLLGEPGVGKTAVVEGLARYIAEGKAPASLLNARIVSLSIGSAVAGAMFRGQFEERVKQVIEEAKENPELILFIDELHTLVGAGAAEGAVGASDLLKPALARGELRVIGATTLDEYRKRIEKDAALERRFQPIMVGEPSPEEAVEMLKILRSRYEQFHGVQISDEAIDAAVRLSDRYINDRFLPDKAVDVMDEAASSVKLAAIERGEVGPQVILALEKEITRIQSEKESAAIGEDYERAAILRQNELQLQQQLEEAQKHGGAQNTLTVGENDIAAIVELWTGAPVTQIVDSERQNLRNLEERLRRRVIGQDEAVSAVARAIRRSRAGMKDENRPIGSFLFMGPTGVGKTELAKALAAAMFGGEDRIIRVDMSEYMEAHTVSRLFGSPPGYIGHDEGGQLTEKVRRNPYSVILFDEIEKAHSDVFNSLLQILDDGRLTDGKGRTVNFKNTIVIMTSNIATSELRKAGLGFMAGSANESAHEQEQQERQSKAMEGLKRAFKPEFINRIDQIVVFNDLQTPQLLQIVDLMLAQTQRRLAEQKIALDYNDDVRSLLLSKGTNLAYGARPLRRAVQTLVDDALADALLAGLVSPGQKAVLTVESGSIVIQAEGEPLPAVQNTEPAHNTI